MSTLDELYDELREVEQYPGEYLPNYGYSSKEEITQLIKLDIQEEEEKEEEPADDDGMDYEALCQSQGLSYKFSFVH